MGKVCGQTGWYRWGECVDRLGGIGGESIGRLGGLVV